MQTHVGVICSIIIGRFRNASARIVVRWHSARRAGIRGFLALAAMAASANAYATILAPGSSTLLSGTSLSADPALAGTVLQDVVSPFTIDLGSGSSVNGFVPVSSDGSIGVAARSGYGGDSTNVNYRLDGLGSIAPSAASRSASGDQVLFGFLSNPIASGQTSRFFFIHTNVTAYNDLGTGTLIGFNAEGGFGQTQFMTFAPDPVPLLPAAWFFSTGLLGFVALASRRRRARELSE